jgi:hypothetical protein
VRFAIPSRRKDFLIAVDSAKRRHLLIEIPDGEPSELSERASRGISIRTVDMRTDDGGRSNFIDIVCLEPSGYSALDTIGAELVDALDAGASISRISLVQNVLAKWRRFWAEVHQGLLSREQHLGLFGELWFLAYWLGPSVGFSKALHAWRGPFGSRNDFEADTIGIEVKVTSKSDISHHINGLEQLLEPAGGELFLMSIAVREEGSAAENLPKLIAHIRETLREDFEALSRFDSCLYSVGYVDALVNEYAKIKFRVRTQKLYSVKDGFPRLVPSYLSGPLLPGVGNVSYELSLNGAEPWCVAKSPLEAEQLLKSVFA